MNYPDQVYDRSNYDLLPFEKMELYNLFSYVPNYYLTPTESTLFGSILKSIAHELGRLEYKVNYYLVAKDPQYLTPSDVKRVFEDLAKINKEYPKSDQYDLRYKDMVNSIVDASLKGTKKTSIEEVISAYTGKPVTIRELYKEVGNGIYDISYKNSIEIKIESDSSDSIITNDLVNSIMLIKPAHIGINLSNVFDEGPDIIASENIDDSLSITMKISETDQLETEFVVAPFISDEPESLVAGNGDGVGILSPRLNRAWEIKSDSLTGLDLD